MAKQRIQDTPMGRLVDYGFEMAGKFYSRYRAFVVDNDDPDGMNRIQVIVPTLNPVESDEIWAFPTGVWGGKDYGTQLLPQKGDMVWIEYEMGDVEFPVWSHAGYGEDEKPEEFETVNHYGFKTPLGSIILINDNEDAEEILVKLSTSKEYISITKDSLLLESKLIKLGKNGDESAVLGDTLKKRMDELTEQVSKLTELISTHTHAGPAGPPIKAVEIVKIKTTIDNIKETYKEILSEKVKIDK